MCACTCHKQTFSVSFAFTAFHSLKILLTLKSDPCQSLPLYCICIFDYINSETLYFIYSYIYIYSFPFVLLIVVFFSFFKCVFNQSVGATNKKQQQIERKKKTTNPNSMHNSTRSCKPKRISIYYSSLNILFEMNRKPKRSRQTERTIERQQQTIRYTLWR